MGLYVEPKGDKKQWCEENGVEIKLSVHTHFNEMPKEYLPVVCVDNGMFYAVAVAYDEREFDYFRDNDDERPKTWYAVPKHILKENCPQWDNYVKE